MRADLTRDLFGALMDGVRQVPRSFRSRSITRDGHEVMRIDRGDVEDRVFCFGGEFGYELLSWLPYLNHVAHELGVELRTASRLGSTPFYTFSSAHSEIAFSWRPDRFGSEASHDYFLREFGDAAVVPTNPPKDGSGGLIVGGIPWEHRWVHRRLTTPHHRPLRPVASPASFLPDDLPVAVINNKDFDNWGNTDPLLRESFTTADLVDLRDALMALGYFVVYHRFDEPVPESRFVLDDEGIFDREGCLDMRRVYRDDLPPSERTKQQSALYGRTSLAICPQGGNSFLPIMFGAMTLVLIKHLRLVEYQDLARIYATRVDVHTSTRSILAAVRHDPDYRPASIADLRHQ